MKIEKEIKEELNSLQNFFDKESPQHTNYLISKFGEQNEMYQKILDSCNVYQNKRCSRVFRQEDRFDGQAYDIQGKVFIEHGYDEDGKETTYSYTNSDSNVPVTFPYTPKTEYVDVGFADESDS